MGEEPLYMHAHHGRHSYLPPSLYNSFARELYSCMTFISDWLVTSLLPLALHICILQEDWSVWHWECIRILAGTGATDPQFDINREFSPHLSGNEVYYTNLFVLLVKNMLCSNLHYQKGFNVVSARTRIMAGTGATGVPRS